MTSVTFHGGVDDIGGNKFLVEDKGTKILMDFGMSFSAEGKFFSQFLQARSSNYLNDMFNLGILPKVKGMYRRDYAKHMGYDGREDTEIDAVLLTHAHVDHCAYIPYLREDIPIYCSEASRLIMQNFDDTGTTQYMRLKEKFLVKDGKNGKVRDKGEDTHVDRDIRTFESGKEFSIDSVKVEPLPVDHSIPGVHAFIMHTSDGSIANTGDLRFHGRRADETEGFVSRCGQSDIDLLLCEGTRVDTDQSKTEQQVEVDVATVARNTRELVICGYPVRDLDRLLSFYNAAKETNRYLVIDMKQAYLLELFDQSERLKGMYPSPTDKNIKIYLQRGSWSILDKDIDYFSEKQLEADYSTWQRKYLGYPNMVDYRDVRANQKEFIFFCSDFRLQDLIDVQPAEGSSYIRSLTEPFDEEMEISTERIWHWFAHFGLLKSDGDWHHSHVSGHGDATQIKRVIDGSNAKSLIPIHTHRPEFHKKNHPNVTVVKQHDAVDGKGKKL